MKDSIGTTAGRIWEYLTKNKETTAIKLKSDLGISNTMLYLSLGWLSREDKIDIGISSNTYKISLKESQAQNGSR